MKLDSIRFTEVVARLKTKSIPFGNDHEDPRNEEIKDPLGGTGRVYWITEDGHLLEIAC